jgi:hypothetical protein
MKWAAIAPPYSGLGFISLHTGSNFYFDLAQTASSALLFTIWAIYLNLRNQFWSWLNLKLNLKQTGKAAPAQVDLHKWSRRLAHKTPTLQHSGALHQPRKKARACMCCPALGRRTQTKFNAIATPLIQTWTGSAQMQTLNLISFGIGFGQTLAGPTTLSNP